MSKVIPFPQHPRPGSPTADAVNRLRAAIAHAQPLRTPGPWLDRLETLADRLEAALDRLEPRP